MGSPAEEVSDGASEMRSEVGRVRKGELRALAEGRLAGGSEGGCAESSALGRQQWGERWSHLLRGRRS